MKKFINILFIFLIFFSPSAFSLSKRVEEKVGFLKLNYKLSNFEIENLKNGRNIEGFEYFLGPENPALTSNYFYLALPRDFNFQFKEKSEIIENKLPIITKEGKLILLNYNLEEKWFPEKPISLIKTGFIRQVPFALFQFYPIQISKYGLKINKEIELNIHYDFKNLNKIEENLTFSALYDSIFLNEWKDKGLPLEKNLAKYWSVPPSNFTVYKISIEKDGIYSLTYDFLDENTDWDLLSVDPRKIHLYNLGQEVPIYITGEADGRFDPPDVLYFYGEYYKNENMEGVWQKGDFTDKNVYWLLIEDTNGERIETKDVSPINNYSQIQNYNYKAFFEENLHQYAFIPEEDEDHWVWKRAYWFINNGQDPIKNHSLFLPGVSEKSSHSCTLTYSLRGGTYKIQNPDHHAKIKINGNLVDEVYFDDWFFFEKTVNFPQSYLGGTGDQTIDLTLEVQNPSEIGVDGDEIFSNWFEITYLRDYNAYNNEIFFSLNIGNWKVAISNFTSDNIILMDITNPKIPLICINGEISGTNPYTLTIENSSSYENFFVAKVPINPPAIEAYSYNDIITENPNYLIIAPKDWLSSYVLDDYLRFREGQGLSVKKVAVEDIYDQFNYGIFSPFPIRSYLEYLYNKSNPPKLTYVLIIGDADYDFKDYGGDGNLNFVPTYMKSSTGYGDFYNPYAYYSFEHFFVTFSGDDNLPEVLLGRISVKSVEEMETVLTKIKNYETNLLDKDYLKDLLHIGGCRDGTYFEEAQEKNKSYVQFPYSVEDIYLRLPPYTSSPGDCASSNYDVNPANEMKDSIDRFNSGKGIVNYIGHGAFSIWDDRGFLSSPQDMIHLTNQGKPSVVLNSNCYTASFYHASIKTTILEDLLNRDKGAISCFGPGTYMNIFQIDWITEPFYSSFFGIQKERNLGLLYYHSFAKVEGMGVDRLAQGLVVLGDPSTKYPAPTPLPPLSFLVQNNNCREVTLSWLPPDEDTYLYNIYRSENSTGPFTKISSNYNGTQYIDNNLTYGINYYYYITAVDINGFEGKGTEIKPIYINPCPPEVPQNFQCADSQWGGRINFLWDLSSEPEVNNYRIYYGLSSGNYPNFKDAGITSSYQIGGFSNGAPVFSKLSAWNPWYESEKTSEISCIPTNINGWKPPQMIYPLVLTKNGTNPTLNFNLPTQNIWGDPINQSNISLCTIYRGENPNFVPLRSSTSPDKIGEVPPSSCTNNQCTFTDNSSPANAYYYVTCQTPNKEESSISISPPRYPENLKVQRIRNNRIITWNQVQLKMDGSPLNLLNYEIYRSLSPDFIPDFKDKSNYINSTTETQYIDTPPDSQTYYYKVMAVDLKGNGGPY